MVPIFVLADSSGWSGLSGVVGVGSICGAATSSATLNARLITCLSGESCVGVRGEPWGVNVGDTASSNIRVAHSTLCSMERDKVDWIVDKSSGLGPTKLCRRSVIVTIGVNHVESRIRLISMYLCHFGSV